MKKELKLKGHILDSLILSKLLDKIEELGVEAYAAEVKVGAKRKDMSEAKFIIETNDDEKMAEAVKIAKIQGASEV